jgi:N-acetylneuraminic acid mutarotase
MRSFPSILILGLGTLGLGSCTTDPTGPPADPASSGPALAVAHNTWVTRRDMPLERYQLTAAVVPNAAGQSIVYAIGGRTSGYGSLTRVQAYNVATNTWSWKANLPDDLYALNGTGVINGKIYVSGGLGTNWSHEGTISSRLYVYDPATNSWTAKRAMPKWGADGVTGVIRNKLYVVTTCYEPGGESDYYFDDCASADWTGSEPPVSNFFRYNPATDRWATLPRPGGMYHMGAVLYDKLYVTDGKTVEIYDPLTNQWMVKTTGGQMRLDAAVLAQGARLYLFGGRQLKPDVGWQTVRTARAYNPATNTWSTVAPLPTARYGTAAARVFLDGRARIEVIGGSLPGDNLQYVP